MNIKTVAKDIFLKIAKSLGLELKEKAKTEQDYDDDGMNPTAIGAMAVSNIAIDDSEIDIDGESERAEILREICEYYTDDILPIASEVSLGTGDCVLRPYTDGTNIGIDVLGNDRFAVIDAIGNKIKGVIMLIDEQKTETDTTQLFEVQMTDGEQTQILKYAYKNGNPIPLTATKWAELNEDETVTANQLLIGRIKCPTINRKDYNSVNGVPITFGCRNIIDEAKKKYKQFNEEYEQKKALIFADKTMFHNNEQGKAVLDGKQFYKLKGDMNGNIKNMIDDYSPTIRTAELQAGEDFNLSVLEMCCGFSRGIFTKPETSFATATEMRNSLKKTFSFVKHFRRNIESGNRMLFNAINIILNVNGAPMGDWEIQHQWSYDYIESTQEKFNQLIQAHSIGAVKTADVTSWVLDMDAESAETYVQEIKDELKADMQAIDTSPAEGDGIED